MVQIYNQKFTYVLLGAIVAIVSARAYVTFIGNGLYVYGISIHHIFYGILLLLFGGIAYFMVGEKNTIGRFFLFLFGAGAGLTVDEFNFLTFNSNAYSLAQYYSMYNVYGDAVLTIVLAALLIVSLAFRKR